MLNLIVAVLAALSLADAGDVLTLTDADFDSRLAGLDLALVKFYAPWYVYFHIWDDWRLQDIFNITGRGETNTTAYHIIVLDNTMQHNAMSITEAARRPLFPAHSNKLKYTKLRCKKWKLKLLQMHVLPAPKAALRTTVMKEPCLLLDCVCINLLFW